MERHLIQYLARIVATLLQRSKSCSTNKKHARVTFHYSERQVDMFPRIVDLFASHGGIILDLYSGSISVANYTINNGQKASVLKNVRLY